MRVLRLRRCRIVLIMGSINFFVVNVAVFTNKQAANAFGERYDDWEVYEREVDEQ